MVDTKATREEYAKYLAEVEVLDEQTGQTLKVLKDAGVYDNTIVIFTSTFENLGGLKQLPGIATQRLMADGYGFGAEGDWKTAALVRTMKVMAVGLEGGNSFMEDYTYHFSKQGDRVLGSHMLEICPSISGEKARCEIYPLGIGGKEDPVRLVFKASPGAALNASIVDIGGRMRLLINNVEGAVAENMPNLPTASVLWNAKPNLKLAAEAWILGGGGHLLVIVRTSRMSI